MNLPFYIAKRYAISFSKNTAINWITVFASIGVVASSMALFVVLSVFSGLRQFSIGFTNALDPELRAESIKGKTILITPKIEENLKKANHIKGFSKVVEERVYFLFNEKEQVAFIKGVDENYPQVSGIINQIYAGDWIEAESNQSVVGAEIARKLNIGLLDFSHSLSVYAPKPGKGDIDLADEPFLTIKLIPSALYSVNEELDNKYVFCNLDFARYVLSLKPNEVSFIEFKIKPNSSEKQAIKELQNILGNQTVIKNRAQLNDALYKMLNTENVAVYLIFTLVIIVALFTLIGALIITIIDKKNNLKTLYNLGLPFAMLRKIFLYQGLLIAVLGGLLGLFIGSLLVFGQEKYEWVMITPNLAYPIVFKIENIIIVFATIVILGYFASKIASNTIKEKLFLN